MGLAEDRKNKAYRPDGFYKAFIIPPREMARRGEWKPAQRAVLEMSFGHADEPACRQAGETGRDHQGLGSEEFSLFWTTRRCDARRFIRQAETRENRCVKASFLLDRPVS